MEINKNNFDNKKITRLNHGSFGKTPEIIKKAYMDKYLEFDNNYSYFYHYETERLLDESLEYLSKIISYPKENLVFTNNETESLSIVINSIICSVLNKDIVIKRIVTTNHEYRSSNIALRFLSKTLKLPLIEIDINALNKKDAADKISNEIRNNDLVLLSQITSPWAEEVLISDIVKKKVDCLYILDASHIKPFVKVDKLVIDKCIVCFTLHKWLDFPRGTGALYVPEFLKKIIRPSIYSYYYEDDFQKSFQWLGTRNFYQSLLGKEVYEYLSGLNGNASYIDELYNYLICKTSSIDRMIRIEANKDLKYMVSWKINISKDKFLNLKEKMKKYNIEVWFNEANNEYILRISLSLYNTKEDINKLLTILEKM